jgi:hypothetical protein
VESLSLVDHGGSEKWVNSSQNSTAFPHSLGPQETFTGSVFAATRRLHSSHSFILQHFQEAKDCNGTDAAHGHGDGACSY